MKCWTLKNRPGVECSYEIKSDFLLLLTSVKQEAAHNPDLDFVVSINIYFFLLWRDDSVLSKIYTCKYYAEATFSARTVSAEVYSDHTAVED